MYIGGISAGVGRGGRGGSLSIRSRFYRINNIRKRTQIHFGKLCAKWPQTFPKEIFSDYT